MTQLDHLVITAPSLAEGAAYVEKMLGVKPQTGGEHLRMGTHNLLLKLGDGVYLEIIAINPQAPKPLYPRWFALDNAKNHTTPSLKTWVARSQNLHATCTQLTQSLGQIHPMQRGNLNWLITIPADGALQLDGVAPTLIEWQTPTHPAKNLQNQDCQLMQLDLYHPEPARLNALLDSMNFQSEIPVVVHSLETHQPAYLSAQIKTPLGKIIL